MPAWVFLNQSLFNFNMKRWKRERLTLLSLFSISSKDFLKGLFSYLQWGSLKSHWGRVVSTVLLRPEIVCLFENLAVNYFTSTALHSEDKHLNEQQILRLILRIIKQKLTDYKIVFCPPAFVVHRLQIVRDYHHVEHKLWKERGWNEMCYQFSYTKFYFN